MSIEIVERPSMLLAGMSIETKPMSPDIPALWPKFVARIDEIDNLLEPRVSYGVMRHETGSMEVLHYMAAVSVSALNHFPPGITALALPAGQYASFRYPLSGLAQGFCEIFTRLLPESGYTQLPGWYFERYDERFDPADGSSQVQICLPVRR
jgi:AraC family transcriptional regulator